jgi:hypothetical protein
MTGSKRLPYLTFAGLLVLSVAFAALSLAYEKKVNDRQNQQIDPRTGTWKPTYDWQAENHRIETSTRLRVGILWVLVAHGVFNAVYASAVIRGWRGIVLGLAFLSLSGFLALILVVGSVTGPAMIG